MIEKDYFARPSSPVFIFILLSWFLSSEPRAFAKSSFSELSHPMVSTIALKRLESESDLADLSPLRMFGRMHQSYEGVTPVNRASAESGTKPSDPKSIGLILCRLSINISQLVARQVRAWAIFH